MSYSHLVGPVCPFQSWPVYTIQLLISSLDTFRNYECTTDPINATKYYIIFLLTCLTTENVLVKDRVLFFVFALHFDFNTNMYVYYERISCI